jgi:uncharacterized protein YndB with AHSA1/START domain
MSRLTTHVFRLATPAPPAKVWEALTSSEPGANFLPRLTLASTWTPGSPLVLRPDADLVVAYGDVIAAEPPSRLSYALDGGHGPATYITWELRPTTAGSIVHLYVDEFDGDDAAEVEDNWLPLLARFQVMLCPSGGPAP